MVDVGKYTSSMDAMGINITYITIRINQMQVYNRPMDGMAMHGKDGRVNLLFYFRPLVSPTN